MYATADLIANLIAIPVGAALYFSILFIYGRCSSRGLDASAIKALPTFSFSEVKDHKIGKGALECAVCLTEFEDRETLRLLPKCDHVFHRDCIDRWLASSTTCPVCRADLARQTGPDPVQSEEAREQSDRSSRDDEIVIQVDEGDHPQPPARRSWSIQRPKVLGFGKFWSHPLVQPGENLDRFTLRLPEGVRKEVIDRAMLQ